MIDWKDAIVDSTTNVLDRIIGFLPELIGVILVLIIGWVVAVLFERLIVRVLKMVGFGKLMEAIRVESVIKKTKFKTDSTKILGALAKWIILVIVFLAAADILGLTQVADFFSMVLGYVPNVIAAVAILLIGGVLAHFLSNIVRGSTEAGSLAYSSFLARLTSIAIWVFAFLAVLVQLGIAHNLISTLFTGFVAMVALAGGLAFGLGGQEPAKRLIEKIASDFQKKD